MSIKILGAEWNKFYSDEKYWGSGQWHDDTVITIDGIESEDYEKVPDEAKIVIKYGYVILNGEPDEHCPSLISYFKKWRKEQTTVQMIVECKKEDQSEIIAAINASGKKHKIN